MFRRVFLVLAFSLLALPAQAEEVRQWAAGTINMPVLTSYQEAIDKAIRKTLVKGPVHKKPGARAEVLITATDGGSRATYMNGSLTPEQVTEFELWSRKWILPVGEPGMAMPVRVWWVKPDKSEKEKLKKGQERTKPAPGLRYSVGYEVATKGSVEPDEVLIAVGLVFSSDSQRRCEEEVAEMPRPSQRVTFWHLDVDGAGAVEAIPQDLYVPPPDPTTREGRQALAEEAAAAEVPGGPEAPGVDGAPEGPKVEGPKAPKFELPGAPKAPEGAPKVEQPTAEELLAEEEAAAPPREWTALETCVAFALTTSRVRAASDGKTTHLDHVPVVVRHP